MQKYELLQISACEYCNLDCIFCNQHSTLYGRENLENKVKEKKMLSNSNLKKFLKNMSHDKFKTISLVSTGEIFVNPEWKKLLHTLFEFNHKNKIGENIVINTNGTLFDQQDIEYIFELFNRYNQSVRFVFSINSFNKKTYKDLTGSDLLHKVNQNAQYFLEKMSKTEKNIIKNIFFSVQFLVLPENEKEFKDFRVYWSDIIKKNGFEPEITSYNKELNKNCSIILRKAFIADQNISDKIFSNILIENNIKPENNTINKAFDDEDHSYDIRFKKPCSALWKYPYISSEGDITICCRDINFEYKYGTIDEKNDICSIQKNNKILDEYKRIHIQGQWKKMPICHGCPGYEYQKDEISDNIEQEIKEDFRELYFDMKNRLLNGYPYNFYNIEVKDKDENSLEKVLTFLRYNELRSDTLSGILDFDKNIQSINRTVKEYNYQHSKANPSYPCIYWFRMLKYKNSSFYTGCERADIRFENIYLYKEHIISGNYTFLPFECLICNSRPEITQEDLFYLFKKNEKEFSLDDGEKNRDFIERSFQRKDFDSILKVFKKNNNRKIREIFWELVKKNPDFLDQTIIDRYLQSDISWSVYDKFSLVKYHNKIKFDKEYIETLSYLLKVFPHPTIIEYYCDYNILNKKAEELFSFLKKIDLDRYMSFSSFKGKKILNTITRILTDQKKIKILFLFFEEFNKYIFLSQEVFNRIYFLFINEEISISDIILILKYFSKDQIITFFEYLSKDLNKISLNSAHIVMVNFIDDIIHSRKFSEYLSFFKDENIQNRYVEYIIDQKKMNSLAIILQNLHRLSFFSKENALKIGKTIFYPENIKYIDKYDIYKNLKNIPLKKILDFEVLYNLFIEKKISVEAFVFIFKDTFQNKIKIFSQFISVDLFKCDENTILYLKNHILDEFFKKEHYLFRKIFIKSFENPINYLKIIEILKDKIIKEDIFILRDMFLGSKINIDSFITILNKIDSKRFIYIVKNILIDQCKWDIFVDDDQVNLSEDLFEKLYYDFLNNKVKPEVFFKLLDKHFENKKENTYHYLTKDINSISLRNKKYILDNRKDDLKNYIDKNDIKSLYANLDIKKTEKEIEDLYRTADFDNCLKVLTGVNPDDIEKMVFFNKDFIVSLWNYKVTLKDNISLKKISDLYSKYLDKERIEEDIKNIQKNPLDIIFICEKVIPEKKKKILLYILKEWKEYSIKNRKLFLINNKRSIEEAGLLKDYSEFFIHNTLYYSLYKLDYYNNEIYEKIKKEIKGIKYLNIIAIKHDDSGLLRKLSGYYQNIEDYKKALYILNRSKDCSYDALKSRIYLQEKSKKYLNAYFNTFKFILKDPVFCTKKSLYLLLKIFKIK